MTTIATFTPVGSADDFRFVNDGNLANRGYDAEFYTTSSKTATTVDYAKTLFSFTDPALAPYVTNVAAAFILNGNVTQNSPAVASGSFLAQGNISGTFSFISTSAITVIGSDSASKTFAAGSTLLNGTFSGAILDGKTSSSNAQLSDSASNLKIILGSNFLDFSQVSYVDLDFVLSSIFPTLSASTGSDKALKSFRGLISGEIATDPAAVPYPITITPTPVDTDSDDDITNSDDQTSSGDSTSDVSAVPEPATWAMMLIGFGLLGTAMRRGRRTATLA